MCIRDSFIPGTSRHPAGDSPLPDPGSVPQRLKHRIELMQEPHVVLEIEPQILHAVFEHGDTCLLYTSYPPSDGESRIENGNLAAKRRRSAEKISKYGLPQQKRILPASGTLRRPARENPELCQHFPAKINFSPARNRQSLPPHSRRIQTIKGLRTQPTAGSVPARRKRLLRKPNLRSPPLPATDSPHGGPDRQPPQLLPQPPQPETSETRPASERCV